MNFLENGKMEVTPGLLAAEARRKEIETNLIATRERRGKQLDIVQKASKALDKLLVARLWEKCTAPKEVLDAKREFKLASENFEDEKDMLSAIETAIKNTASETVAANGEVKRTIDSIISSAAQKTEREIRVAVEMAMENFIACQVAIRGSLSVMGSQHELEMMAGDIGRLKVIDSRVGAAYLKLEEAVQ